MNSAEIIQLPKIEDPTFRIKPKRSFDYSHITTAKGIPVASLTRIPSWLDLLTDCEATVALGHQQKYC